VAGVSLLVAIIGVQLVAASDFAGEQVLLNKPLNSMNFWSQLVVSLLAAGAASGVWQIGYKAIKNIGQNHDTTVVVKEEAALCRTITTTHFPLTMMLLRVFAHPIDRAIEVSTSLGTSTKGRTSRC